MIDLNKVSLTPEAAEPLDIVNLIRGDLLALAVLEATKYQMDTRCQEDPGLLEIIGESFDTAYTYLNQRLEKELYESPKLLSDRPDPVFFNAANARRFITDLIEDAKTQARFLDTNELITYYAELGLNHPAVRLEAAKPMDRSLLGLPDDE